MKFESIKEDFIVLWLIVLLIKSRNLGDKVWFYTSSNYNFVQRLNFVLNFALND